MIHYTAGPRDVSSPGCEFCHSPVMLYGLPNLLHSVRLTDVRGEGCIREVRPDREMATVVGTRNSDGSITIERVLKNVKVTSSRGTLKPQFAAQRSVTHGRRRMSPWQARAVGSGRGVIASPDTVFTDSPQSVQLGWAASNACFTGHSTMSAL